MKKKGNKVPAGVRSARIQIFGVILAAIIGAAAMIYISKKNGEKESLAEKATLFRFEEGSFSVLILPFQHYSAKKEDMARALYGNLYNQQKDGILPDLEPYYVPEEEPPLNDEEARKLGAKYNALMVIYGESFSDVSKVDIRYTITARNAAFERIRTGRTGLWMTTVDRMYEGPLPQNVDYIVNFLAGMYNYFQKGDLTQAVNYLNKAVGIIQDGEGKFLIPPYFYLGEIHRQLGKLQQAIEYHDKLLALNPNHLNSIVSQAYAYATSGHMGKAMQNFQKAVEISVTTADDYNTRGTVYDVLGQLEQALEDYNKALELQPKFTSALNNRGIIYTKLGQHKKAIGDFNKAIKLNPNIAMVFYNRSYVYISKYLTSSEKQPLKQLPKALEDLNRAVELNPKHPNSYLNLGYIYNEFGEHDKAIKEFQKLLALDPKSVSAYNHLAVAYIKLGQHEKAIETCNKALELDPNFPDAHYNKACAFCGFGEKDAALQSLEEAFRVGFLNRNSIDHVIKDSDLKCIWGDPRFEKLIEEQKRVSKKGV